MDAGPRQLRARDRAELALPGGSQLGLASGPRFGARGVSARAAEDASRRGERGRSEGPGSRSRPAGEPSGLTHPGGQGAGAAAAEQVEVQVEDALPGALAVVRDQPVVLETEVARDGGGPRDDLADPGASPSAGVGEPADVLPRNDEDVRRGLRRDVVERVDLVVGVDLLRRDLARRDPAEEAVASFDPPHLRARAPRASPPSSRSPGRGGRRGRSWSRLPRSARRSRAPPTRAGRSP